MGFTLVETGLVGPPQVRLLKSVERERRAFDPAKFGQREIQSVVALVESELAQDREERDGPILDGCDDPDDIVLIGFDRGGLYRVPMRLSMPL